jgi:hypothetical protein
MSKPVRDIPDDWKLCMEDVANGMSVSVACKKYGFTRTYWYRNLKNPVFKSYFDGVSGKKNPIKAGRPKRNDITNDSLTERAMEIVHAKLNDEDGNIGKELFDSAIQWLRVVKNIKEPEPTNEDETRIGNYDTHLRLAAKAAGVDVGTLIEGMATAKNGKQNGDV